MTFHESASTISYLKHSMPIIVNSCYSCNSSPVKRLQKETASIHSFPFSNTGLEPKFADIMFQVAKFLPSPGQHTSSKRQQKISRRHSATPTPCRLACWRGSRLTTFFHAEYPIRPLWSYGPVSDAALAAPGIQCDGYVGYYEFDSGLPVRLI